MSVAAIRCEGTGPSHLGEASRAVQARVQQHEATSHLALPTGAPAPMSLEWSNIRIQELLGSGSFSVVYKAQVKALARQQQQLLNGQQRTAQNKRLLQQFSSDTDSCGSQSCGSCHNDNGSNTNNNNDKENAAQVSAPSDDGYYAIKNLSTETICCNESFVTGAIDLALEATILSKLQHENIIRVFGVKGGNIAESFSTSTGGGGGFFIVMELLHETLDQRLEQWRQEEAKEMTLKNFIFKGRKRQCQQRLTGIADRLEHVIMGVVRGMEYIHSKHIILRDLKPHNIGFDRHTGKVKIFDFGLARELVCDEGSDKLIPRMNTGIAGTLRYISPENALGQPCGLSVDVYSFAILLYEVITLQVPFFDIKVVQDFKEKVIRGRHRPSLKFVPSALIQDLLGDSWHPNPHARPTFAEIRCIMEQVIAEGMLTTSGEWRKVILSSKSKSASSTATSVLSQVMDGSVGGGSINRLGGSHHKDQAAHAHGQHHHHQVIDQDEVKSTTSSSDGKGKKSQRARMAGSFHGGLDDQSRSFNENISFNSTRSNNSHRHHHHHP